MKTPLLNKLENSKLKKLKLFFLIFFLITLSNYSQTTYVPDNNFENYLETHDADGNSVSLGDSSSMGNGVAYDDYVNTNKIDNVTKLDISNKNISSLKGIEDFTDLRQLYFTNNNVSSVDLSSNSQLGVLFCGENNLTEFNIYSNSLLQILDCHKTGLSELNISNNDDLHSIYAYDNNLSVFDTSNILDLKLLSIGTNNIKTLNLSKNTKLENLYCKDNSLTILNVANGKNSILNYFQTTGNTNLTCIQVDDANNIGANWTKDTTANYSESCITNVPDDNFEQALIDLGYDDVLDNYVFTTNISGLTSLNIHSKNIADLTGIEAFVGLTFLGVNNNSLTEVDLGNNINLESVSIQDNQLTELDLSKNVDLYRINCDNNLITELDLSLNIVLRDISCYDNKLTTLNIQNGNNINITYFRIGSNPDLTCIQVDNVSANSWTDSTTAQLFSEDCSATASVIDNEFNTAISTYPNPVKNRLYVTINNGQELENIQVFNVLGEKIIEQKNNNVDFTNISSGMYLVKIKNTRGKIATRKIIKN